MDEGFFNVYCPKAAVESVDSNGSKDSSSVTWFILVWGVLEMQMLVLPWHDLFFKDGISTRDYI